MCGIAGIRGNSVNEVLLKEMASVIRRRGPDESNIWIDKSLNLGFSHTRLSIVDLTNAGSQPFVSKCKNFILIFNGEIYNHTNLRDELMQLSPTLSFEGHSDTETLMNCIQILGLRKTLTKLNGMFAFALFDKKNETLNLCRDRFGEKPLYYGFLGGEFVFGSSLKIFSKHPKFKSAIDSDSVFNFLQMSYVPENKSIFKNIYKLPPGSWLALKQSSNQFKIEKYFSATNIFESPSAIDFDQFSESEIIEKIDSILSDSVRLRMMSDVPIGAFLSGGYDSTAICLKLTEQTSTKIKTFSLGYDDHRYDETPKSDLIAKYLGTDHTKIILNEQDVLLNIDKVTKSFDEPFADASQIPTYFVTKLASENVKVILSGDGGDEVFSGYNRYKFGPKIWQILKFFPLPLRKILSHILTKIPLSGIDDKAIKRNYYLLANKIQKLANILNSRNQKELYMSIVSIIQLSDNILKSSKSLNLFDEELYSAEFINKINLSDIKSYLPDDILVKLDRVTMFNSIEGRAPFLDHRLVELVLSLPYSLKNKQGIAKYLLRKVVHKKVPSELMYQTKRGFGIPLDRWMSGMLHDWSRDTLLNKSGLLFDYVEESKVIDIWNQVKKGIPGAEYKAWNMIMLNSWSTSVR